jgi:hypothetical protein
LLHLLIKKIVYIEDASESDDDGKKRGKIKMDLWELPAIGPSKKNSATRFAERSAWRSGRQDGHGKLWRGKTGLY